MKDCMLLHMVSFAISIFVKCCPAACDGAQCLREALDTVTMTDPYLLRFIIADFETSRW